MQYLVINNNKNTLQSFADQYKLFDDREKAIACFIEIGGEEDFMGLSNKAGMASIQKCGDLDVTFLPIETQG